jgi:arylsulfatase A-like enzyme
MTDQDEVNRQWMLAKGYHPQRKTFDRGLDFLFRNQSVDNWFLQIETFDPHEPFFTDEGPSDPHLREYTGPRFDWPAYGPVTETPMQVDHARRSYGELVRMCDRQLGRILDAFDRYRLWDNTALIVTTDHGFLLGEHNQWGKMVQPLFEEVAHIPLFAWVPPSAARDGLVTAEPGSRCERVTQTVDLAPSILALHDVAPVAADGSPSRMDGVSLWAGPREREALFGLFGGHAAVTDGRAVYMRAADQNGPLLEHTLMPWNMREPAPTDDLEQTELVVLEGFAEGRPLMRYPGHMHSPKLIPWLHDLLFDVQQDPGQTTNLLEMEDETAETEWRGRLIQALQRTGAPESVFARLRLEE